MNQEESTKVEINKEVEEKGNFFLLWKEKDENDIRSDIIDGIEKLSDIQEKTSASEWKRLKNKNKSSLNLNNVKYINILINHLNNCPKKKFFLKNELKNRNSKFLY